MTNMICSNCSFNTSISEAKFCPNCGESFSITSQIENSLTPQEESKIIKEEFLQMVANQIFNFNNQLQFPKYDDYFTQYTKTKQLIEVFWKEDAEDDRTLTDKFLEFWEEEELEETAQLKSLKALDALVKKTNLNELLQEIDFYSPDEMIRSILNSYHQVILHLNNNFPDISAEEFQLNSQTVLTATTNCSNLLKKEAHLFLYQAKHLIAATKEFKNLLAPTLLKAKNSNKDLAIGIAKGLSSGVLAIGMPWVGVPALFATYIGSQNKKSQDETLEEQFDTSHEQYVNQWEVSHKEYKKMKKQQAILLQKELIQPLILQLNNYLNQIQEKYILEQNLLYYKE